MIRIITMISMRTNTAALAVVRAAQGEAHPAVDLPEECLHLWGLEAEDLLHLEEDHQWAEMDHPGQEVSTILAGQALEGTSTDRLVEGSEEVTSVEATLAVDDPVASAMAVAAISATMAAVSRRLLRKLPFPKMWVYIIITYIVGR